MQKNIKIKVALAGNPNSGKSTIFNSLTGSNQHVGNYPGITIEKKERSKSYKGYDISFVDLPGMYSLSAFSDDEIVARDFLIKEKPDIVINTVDTTNLERNLYLFTQLTELSVPIIVVLNMLDILGSQGKIVDKKAMSDLLGVPVISTVANRKIGIDDILDSIISLFENKKLKNQIRARVDFGDVIKEQTDKLEDLISKNPTLSIFPEKWLGIEFLDNGLSILELISGTNNESEILAQLKKSKEHIKEHFGQKADKEIVDRRYGFAKSIAKIVVKKTGQNNIDITDIIDTFVLDKYLGIPIFILVMYLIFKFTFTFSGPTVNLFGSLFKWIGRVVASLLPISPLRSLIVNGVIAGVGGVLGFFPMMLFMFFAIAFFEDSGYMARAAFVMDKVMSRFGLHGKSFLPLMLSTNGCAVTGILSTRTLDSKRDRLITMFIAPFMICGAKLTVFALIIGAFFYAKYQTGIMVMMYFLSIAIALCIAKLLSSTILKEEAAYFVIELPSYHIPTIKGLLLKMWERGILYVRKAGTTVVFASILIWIIFAYPKAPVNKDFSENEQVVLQTQYSFAGKAGKILEPFFKPIGMDGNRAVALIAGFAAKEVIVSTLGTIYAIEDDSGENLPLKEKIANDNDWSSLKGITFLIFCLIYIPCVVSVIVFLKETGSNCRWVAVLVMGSTASAWIVSFIIFQIGTLLKH